MGHDEVMLGVDGGLDVVADDTTAATAGRHGPSIRVGQRDLLVRRGVHDRFKGHSLRLEADTSACPSDVGLGCQLPK